MSAPRDFEVFTTSNGNPYACYIQNGPRIFRVQSLKAVQTAWQDYWESWGQEWAHPDAMAPLKMDVLRQAVGTVPWVHFGSDYFFGVADEIFEADGELRIKLHARKPEPKHIFALRGDKWEGFPALVEK